MGPLLDLKRGRVAAEKRLAIVLAGRDQVAQVGVAQRAGLDHLTPPAQVTRLDAVGDQPAQTAAVDACGVDGALFGLADSGQGAALAGGDVEPDLRRGRLGRIGDVRHQFSPASG